MAAPELPVDFNQIRTVFDDFIHEVDEDFQSPGISHFQTIMPKTKKNVLSLEQVCFIVIVMVTIIINAIFRVYMLTKRLLLG